MAGKAERCLREECSQLQNRLIAKPLRLKIQHAREKLVTAGAQHLLQAERKIHQELRFMQGKHLRLHLYRWTHQLIHAKIPADREANPLRTSATKAARISLLENRFIDAICAPYPLVARANKTSLAIIPIVTSFLELLCRADGAGQTGFGSQRGSRLPPTSSRRRGTGKLPEPQSC